MKEDILRFFFTGKIMHIINQENIDHLIEMDEIISILVSYGVYVLLGKSISRNIQDCFVGVLIFYLYSYGMGKVGFAKATASIEKERVE